MTKSLCVRRAKNNNNVKIFQLKWHGTLFEEKQKKNEMNSVRKKEKMSGRMW